MFTNGSKKYLADTHPSMKVSSVLRDQLLLAWIDIKETEYTHASLLFR